MNSEPIESTCSMVYPRDSSPSSAELAAEKGQRSSLDAEYRELWKYFQSKTLSAERQYFTSQTYPVRIIELFILTGIVALGLTLIRNFDLVGSLLIFLLASLFSTLASWLTFDANRVRFWNQLLWGIVLPIAAVLGDPFVFGTFKGGVPVSIKDELCAGPYFVLGYSMLLIAFSWFLKPASLPWINALVAGQLRCTAVILFLIGLALLPIAMFGMLALVGLVGLVPLIAGTVYLRTGAMHYRWACLQSESKMRTIYSLGVLSILFGFLLVTLLGAGGVFRRQGF